MIRLSLTGRTYAMKEQLKASGFRWDGTNKNWYKLFEDEESELVTRLADAYEDGTGITCCVKALGNPNERKYFVKESYRFNLESMNDKLHCIGYDFDDGKITEPVEILGYTITCSDDIQPLLDEVNNLLDEARWVGKVTGKQYGRIQEIVNWRVTQRYLSCIEGGMSEADAGRCFEDM